MRVAWLLPVLLLAGCSAETSALPSGVPNPPSTGITASANPSGLVLPLPAEGSPGLGADQVLPPGVPQGALEAAQMDPSVGPAVRILDLSRQSAWGEWLLLEFQGPADGLAVLLRMSQGQWSVVDAGGAGVGCPFVEADAARALGLACRG